MPFARLWLIVFFEETTFLIAWQCMWPRRFISSSASSQHDDMNSGEQPKAAKRPRIDDDNANDTEHAASACAPTAVAVTRSTDASPSPSCNFWHSLTDELAARVLSFLGVQDLLRARVCRSLRAVSKMVTPHDRLVARNRYNRSGWHGIWKRFGRDVLPKVEEIYIESSFISLSHLLQFQHLKRLSISPHLGMAYHRLFSLHCLERLELEYDGKPTAYQLQLSQIAPLTNLKELRLQLRSDYDSGRVLGNLSSLSGLKKLTYLRLSSAYVGGNLLSLAELPSLSLLDLRDCPKVSGDIRDIDPHHFPSLKILKIESTRIYGRPATPLMSIDDASVLFAAWGRVISQPRPLSTIEGGKMPSAELDRSSPDDYEPGRWTVYARYPPFTATMIRVASRLGYRWKNKSGQACDVCWLSPEPSSDEADHETYWAKLYQLEQVHLQSIYKGHSRPPTREEWQQIARI